MTDEPSPEAVAFGEAIEAGAALIAVIDAKLDLLTSGDTFLVRQMGAGCLARCRAVLESILLVAPVRPDVVGWLNRNILESFTVGVLCLLGSERDIAGLRNSLTGNLAVQAAALGKAPLTAKPAKGDPKFNVEVGLRRVEQLIAEAGRPSKSVGKMYDVVYRAESTLGGHGLGLAFPYLRDAPGPVNALEPRPGSVNSNPVADVVLGATLTGWLAHETFERFGISSESLKNVSDELARLDAAATVRGQ